MVRSYPGAPAAVALSEVLIATRIHRLVILGEAGSISPKIGVGEILVPTFAIREEGTSYHYLPPNTEAKPSFTLLKKIKVLLNQMNVPHREGGVWTTDAPFRETMDKVLSYSRAGVVAVDMECSAIFCLSMYRCVESAAILVITDTLYEGVWSTAFQEPKVTDIEKRISEILVKYWNRLAK